MKQKTEPRFVWQCKRDGSINMDSYVCEGSYGKMTRNGIIRIQCRHTPIHNPLISKYCLSVDHNKNRLGVKTYNEYVERYS